MQLEQRDLIDRAKGDGVSPQAIGNYTGGVPSVGCHGQTSRWL